MTQVIVSGFGLLMGHNFHFVMPKGFGLQKKSILEKTGLSFSAVHGGKRVVIGTVIGEPPQQEYFRGQRVLPKVSISSEGVPETLPLVFQGALLLPGEPIPLSRQGITFYPVCNEEKEILGIDVIFSDILVS